jgi:hypothetical protein
LQAVKILTHTYGFPAFKTSHRPIVLAVLIRLAVWLLLPATRFASDEDSYFQVGTALLQGHQDVFWPPVTGWLIALVRLLTQSDSVALVRLAWIAMDACCVAFIHAIAMRLGRSLWPADAPRIARLARLAAFGYALYLPAIAHAQFATSEIPALFGTLLLLVVVTAPRPSWAHAAIGGVVAGVLCLTRPSLLPLLIAVPLAVSLGRRSFDYAKALTCIAIGSLVIGGYVLRNWQYAGEATISTNSAYNLYIGNRDMYAEDLDLFNPRATPEQIEFRRQQFSGELPPFTQTPAESQRLAMQWIREHPVLFARRALGRLARVFVPKTDVLELIGGSARSSVFSPTALALLLLANAEWTLILAGGLVGLVALRHQRPDWALLFAAVVAGALVLCLIAISKPRYSFVFDPILIICASVAWINGREGLAALTRIDRRALAAIFLFLAWGWVAFVIFSVTSRIAP